MSSRRPSRGKTEKERIHEGINQLVLLGIAIVIVGFALKLDSILIIAVASVATALIGGISPVD